ncbi:MAG TPA: tyrosine-protein phosphatase [Streptosporangiaceae bacterium]|nr:tyrosine-protein phosphatase [Streptosporangiaceae bacterium]
MAGSRPEDLTQARTDDLAGLAGLIQVIGAAPRRHLPVPGTLNFRDAGGYPTADGRVTAWRRLFRSDGLHRLGRGAARKLGTLDLRTVLDLRTRAETQIAPSPVDDLAAGGALTLHISLTGDNLDALPPDLAEIYDFIVDQRGTAIAAAIRALARPGGLPGLVHCTAGKDRTGIVVAFALAAVGVPDQIIAADYALSSLYLDPQHTPAIGRVQEGTGLGGRLTAALLASPPELMLRVLARARQHGARQHGGSITGYLAGHGVTCAELTALRSALVTQARTR